MATISQTRLAKRFLAFSISLSIAAGMAFSFSPPTYAATGQAPLLNNEGVKALNANNFQLAIAKFEEALKLDPTYQIARDNLAIAYNNYALKLPSAQAIKFFHKAAAMSPGNTTTLQNLDTVIRNMGKTPSSYADRVQLGKDARLAGDFDGAIVEYQAALRIKNDAKLHAELGDVLRVRDRVDDAINEYKAAISAGGLDPGELASANVKLGQSYQAKKDLKNAIQAFGEALRYKSDDRDVLEALKTGWEEALRENPQAPENHIGLGQAYQYMGDFGMARAEYQQALMFDKNNAIAQKLLADLGQAQRRNEITKHINNGVDLQLRKNFDEAIKEYMVALQADPNNADIYVNIGSALQAKEDYARAIAAYQKALAIQPANKAAAQGIKASTDAKANKDLDNATAAASDLYKSKRYDEALAKYQEVLRVSPQNAAVHFNVAAALQQLGRIDESIAEYKLAVSYDQDNAEYKKYLETALDDKANPIITKAVDAHKNKDYVTAIDLYQQAINLRPKRPELYFNLASAFYARQQYDLARAQYNKALEVDPKGQINDLWMLGSIDEHFGKGYDAMDKYKKYLAGAPSGDYAKVARERLEALTKNPQDTVKIKSEDELAKIKNASDAANKAAQLQIEKKFDEAIPLYMQAIQLQPLESTYVYNLGTLYFQKGDLDQAVSWIDKAVAMDPANKDYPKYKVYLSEQKAEKLVGDAVAKQTAEDFSGAIGLYQQALQLVPKNAAVWTNLGSALYATDNFSGALDAFQKAVAIDPKAQSTDFYSIGRIMENNRRGADALSAYQKFLAANPGDKLAQNAKDRIAVLTKNLSATETLPTRSEAKVMQQAQAAYDKGATLQQAGDLDAALTQYQQANQLSPKDPFFIIAIGSVYQTKKDFGNAALWYQKAVDLAPQNADYKKYLAAVKGGQADPILATAAEKLKNGDYRGAVADYRQALQLIDDPSIHTDLGSALQQADDFQGALTEYQTALRMDPKGQAQVQYFIGALLENFNRGTEALQNYREYVTKNPGGTYVSYANSRVGVLSKTPTAVVKLQTKAERESSVALQGLYDGAVKKQQSGDLDGAIADYLQLIQKSPNEASYVFALATAYQQKNDMAKAAENYKKAAALDPGNADYKKYAGQAQGAIAGGLVEQATAKFAAKDFAGAIELYKQAIASAPANAQANIWTNLGIAYQYADQFQLARDAYKKGYDLDPKTEIDNLYFMGPLDETLGRGTAAFEDYKNYLAYAPKGKYATAANARYQVLYYDKSKLQKMQTSTESANLDAANDLYNQAVTLQQAGKNDEAIAKYQEALTKNNNSDSVWYSLGTAQQAKGDYQKALESYQKAASIKPAEATYKKVIADLKAGMAAPLVEEAIKKQTTKNEKGEYDLAGAIASYEAALRISDDASTRMNLGTAYQANKMMQKALSEYMKALQLDPKMNDVRYLLGTVYEALNQPGVAAQEYRKYLQGQPAGQYAADAKERLKIVK